MKKLLFALAVLDLPFEAPQHEFTRRLLPARQIADPRRRAERG